MCLLCTSSQKLLTTRQSAEATNLLGSLRLYFVIHIMQVLVLIFEWTPIPRQQCNPLNYLHCALFCFVLFIYLWNIDRILSLQQQHLHNTHTHTDRQSADCFQHILLLSFCTCLLATTFENFNRKQTKNKFCSAKTLALCCSIFN